MNETHPTINTRPESRGRREVRYPESDGKPLGETGVHINVLFAVLDMLRRHYKDDPRAAVLANMFIYFEEGNPRSVVSPDVFVTLNVPADTTRRTFKVWLEGKGPDLVIEITSKKTRKEDLNKKLEIYRDALGVREYILFDPLEEYLKPSLQGHRLVEGRYEPFSRDASGIFSEVLGLRLQRDGMDLRFIDPATGARVPTGTEEAEARARLQDEVDRLNIEAEARARLQDEVDSLRREVEALRRRLPEVEG